MPDDLLAGRELTPYIDPTLLRYAPGMQEIRAALATWSCGSFAEAGRLLSAKPSSVSLRVSRLEQAVGTQIFVRNRSHNGNGKRLALTSAGAIILPIAQRAVIDLATVCLDVRETCAGHDGLFDIGCYAPIGTGKLHQALITAAEWFDPHIRCRLVTIEHDRVCYELASRRIDVAIIRGTHAPFEGRCQPLWSERLVVAIAARHRLISAAPPQQNALTWDQLARETFLVSRHGPVVATRAKIGSRVAPLGIEPVVETCPSDPYAVMQMVASGQGICLVPESVIKENYPGVVFREIDGASGEDCTTYYACWRDDNRHPARKRFLGRLFHRFQVGEVDL